MTHSLAVLTLTLNAALSCDEAKAEPAPSTAVSQSAPASSSEHSPLPEVTIEAQRQALSHRLYEFVVKLTDDSRFYGESLPRWHTPVCFAVAGLPGEEGRFVLDRLSQIARSIGVRVARPACQYNFFVVFSTDPGGFIKQAVHLRRHVFDDSMGMEPLRRFLIPGKSTAVRAWHNAAAVSRNGAPISSDSPCVSITIAGKSIPVSCQYHPTRIEFYDVLEFSLALVVIDTNFPKVANLGQITDYAAMVGLADIDLDTAIADAPSILQLFAQSQRTPPAELTSWDRAFLTALYHTDQGSRIQRSQIVTRMVHEIAP